MNVSGLDAPVNWKLLQQAVAATGLRIVGISGCKDAELKAEIDRAGLPILTEGKEKAARPAPAAVQTPLLRCKTLHLSQKRD